MAKQDPFEKFKSATLGGKSLSEAVNPAGEKDAEPKPEAAVAFSPLPSPAPSKSPAQQELTPIMQRVSKTAGKDQVGFYLDKELKKRIGLLKYELGISFNDLYEEAIADLLKKYHKL